MRSRRALDDSVLLDLVGEMFGVLERDELRRAMITALRRVIPADWASLNEIGPDRVVSVVDPPLEQEWLDRFAELAHENPLVQYWQRTRDGRAYRFSDVTATRSQLESTRLYREVYVPLGVNHQIAFTLPSDDHAHLLGIALSREETDFTDEERDFLNRARPYLIQAYRNALAHARLQGQTTAALEAALAQQGLTAREAEVVRFVALGLSNHHIAERLGLSARTVQKHLERAFRKLDVRTRSAAAARAWDLATSSPA